MRCFVKGLANARHAVEALGPELWPTTDTRHQQRQHLVLPAVKRMVGSWCLASNDARHACGMLAAGTNCLEASLGPCQSTAEGRCLDKVIIITRQNICPEVCPLLNVHCLAAPDNMQEMHESHPTLCARGITGHGHPALIMVTTLGSRPPTVLPLAMQEW